MTSKAQTKRQNMRAHLTKALDSKLQDGEELEVIASQGQLFLPIIFRVLQLFKMQPPAYLVLTNQRVLLVNLPGKFPTKDIAKVGSADIIEQRPRNDHEEFTFATSARELSEPGRTIGSNPIKVAPSVFTPSMTWMLV